MKELKVPLFDLIICLSDAMDCISPSVVNHHKQVSYVAFSIASEMGLDTSRQTDLILAGALHDIGAFSLQDRLDSLEFEAINPHSHAEQGYRLLRYFTPFSGIAEMVRFHHVPWNRGKGRVFQGKRVPLESHLLNLADRVSILLNRHEVLGQAGRIIQTVREHSGTLFHPDMVTAFINVAAREYFWLDLVSPSIPQILSKRLRSAKFDLDMNALDGFAKLFSWIIDFKSPFTATHSSGVASTAERLSNYFGLSGHDQDMMRIAGYLHDLGKLAVPVEILDKPAKLAKKEINIVRHHAFYTYRLIETIPAMQTINAWAAFHHEHLNGTGYPFHLTEKDLPIGSQIMAVADKFTALTEDRPYRKGMSRVKTLGLLDSMSSDREINGDIVHTLRKNYEELNSLRSAAQAAAARDYQKVRLP